MPAINLPTINITDSDFKSQETMNNILDTLQKYRKELNFLLMNLDVDNMPAIGGLIGDLEGDYSLINQTVDGILLSVGNIEGDISAIQIKADEILATVANNEGDISALQIQATGILASVSDAEGNIAALQITAGQIQTTVLDLNTYIDEQVVILDGKISTINTTISDQYSSITQRADAIELAAGNLATTVTNNYNDITGSISSLSTTVTQNKAAIDLRADGIVSSVSSLSTTVTNNYNAITGELDSITTDISDAYSEISQLADDISLKVTIDEVTNYLSINQSGVQIAASNIELNGVTRVNADLTLGSASTGSTALRFGSGALITGQYGGQLSNLSISASKVDFVGSELDFTGCNIIGFTGGTAIMKFA